MVLAVGFFNFVSAAPPEIYSTTPDDEVEVRMDLPRGWSMVSLPVRPAISTVTTLFPGAVVVYKYQKGTGYVRVTGTENLEIGMGYWILLDSPQSYVIRGMKITEYTISVEDGWYMIGGCTLPAKKMITTGRINVIYGYTPGVGYTRLLDSETLNPGKGYWILLNHTSDGAEFIARTDFCSEDSNIVANLNISERFNVSHPDQIIDFDLEVPLDPNNTYHVHDSNCRLVPFQLLDSGSRIALRVTGGLAAGQSRSWTLRDGPSPTSVLTYQDKVHLIYTGQYLEVTNGITGVRIVKSLGPSAIGQPVPAPIQGVMLNNGVWAANGPNYILSQWANRPEIDSTGDGAADDDEDGIPNAEDNCPWYPAPQPDTDDDGRGDRCDDVELTLGQISNENPIEVAIKESGPLKVVVEVSYSINRPSCDYSVPPEGYTHGSCFPQSAWDSGRVTEGDPNIGRYTSTITLEAGQPSILFEDDTDLCIDWRLNFADIGFSPTLARYQGDSALGDTRFGYEYEQQGSELVKVPYQGVWRSGQNYDAFVDMPFEAYPRYTRRVRGWGYYYRSGHYWQIYDDTGPSGSPRVGIFSGRASRLIGGINAGPEIYCVYRNGTYHEVGVRYSARQNNPMQVPFIRNRVSWGLFVGDRGSLPADVYEPHDITWQMSLHGGINLNKVHRYKLDVLPSDGFNGLFLSKSKILEILEKIRMDVDFFNRIKIDNPYRMPLWEAIHHGDNDAIQAFADETIDYAHSVLDTYIDGQGIYEVDCFGWHMALKASGALSPTINLLLLLSEEPNSPISPEQVAALNAIRIMYAYLLWDEDIAPLMTDGALGYSNSNMFSMHWGARELYALDLSYHPDMAHRATQAIDRTVAEVRKQLADSGAHLASFHYSGAAWTPTMNNLLQIQNNTSVDPFNGDPPFTETKMLMENFAEFYMHALTPPEIRFGGDRKFVAIGDGCTEGVQLSPMFGIMGTAFRNTNTLLANRLFGAWQQTGRHHSDFSGSSVLQLDEDLASHSVDPHLGDADFGGYMSVLRHGWGTPDESAIWFIHGSHYRDHRHGDQGSFILYALGAPVSIDFGAWQSGRCHAPGTWMHNTVVFENELEEAWTSGDVSLNYNYGWGKGNTGLISRTFDSSTIKSTVSATFERSDGNSWKRTIDVYRPTPSTPVFRIRDDFSGDKAAEPKIVSLMLMAEGAIQTPDWSVTPVIAATDCECSTTPPELNIPIGVTCMQVTGQWLVDWDLCLVTAEEKQAYFGHFWHNVGTSPEIAEYINANNGAPFEEHQHILRVRGTSEFYMIIIPYLKGQRPEELTITLEDQQVVVTRNGSSLILMDS